MQIFAENPQTLDGPIRANRFADSRESLDSRESPEGSRNEPPFFCESPFGGQKISESQVWGDSHESLERYKNKDFSANRFAWIAPIRVANRRSI